MTIDFKKSVPGYRAKVGVFDVVEIPAMQYLMIDGHGDPNTASLFQQSITTLYPVAYKLKFMSKNDLQKNYVVPPLEGLWWADDMTRFTHARDKPKWQWTLMLMVPDWINTEAYTQALDQVTAKKPAALIDALRLEVLTEGKCLQTLHVGSFDDEGPVLQQMHEQYISGQGLAMRGKHHEIYLSDFRRTPPAKRRTILRQPVTDA